MALLLLAGFSATACERRHEGPIRVTVIGEPASLADPSSRRLGTAGSVLASSVAQGLVRFDARGQIVPGLAERWNVSDDGLSYIFRLANAQWPDGRRITARQVARILRRHIDQSGSNALRDSLAAVSEVVAMTDRVIEIRLSSPRPHLLQILAQPDLAMLFEGQGSGPLRLAAERADGDGPQEGILLEREVPIPDEEEESRREEVLLLSATAQEAIEQFRERRTDLVLGGTFADLPLARTRGISAEALRFDPVAGLFGFVPARSGGPLADPDVRRLLARAIDRGALVAALNVPGLLPRTTLLEPDLQGLADPQAPDWASVPAEDRQASLRSAADSLFAGEDKPTLRVALPDGPGADILMDRLVADWGALGLSVERVEPGAPADLKLIDKVAPAASAAWYLRLFRCEQAPVCSAEADDLLQAARAAPVVAQRMALLGEAARLMDSEQLFVPLAAPIRWSLVSSRVQGFATNRFALHPLTALEERLNPERTE